MYDFYEPIEKAYEWNSARLLEMIMGECELISRLDSMNHYFFFDRGDLFSHFYDGCGDILEKQSGEVKMERLESQLEQLEKIPFTGTFCVLSLKVLVFCRRETKPLENEPRNHL